jgi:putative NIF3 family GTP cyclohydrolase 1 type 2
LIASVPGGGNLTDYLAQAHDKNVDLFVTGETSLYLLEYARFLSISALVYSHNYTENFGTRNLAQKIADGLNVDEIIRFNEPHF